MQSVEQSFEQLRDLVKETLEQKGILQDLKTNLRHHVFNVLEGHAGETKPRPLPLDDPQTQTTLNLIREFLLFHGLEHTLSILNSESRATDVMSDRPERRALAASLNIDANSKQSLLRSFVMQKETKTAKDKGSALLNLAATEQLMSAKTSAPATISLLDAQIKELDAEEARLREEIKSRPDDDYDDDFDIDLPETSEEVESEEAVFQNFGADLLFNTGDYQ